MIIKKRLKKHSLKFISAFLSIFLWVYVLNSEKVKFEKTVSLEYILPVDMMFAQKPPHEVTFLIEGPRAFVRTVSEKEDRLVIDLNRANSRKQLNFHVDINPAQLNLPFGMIVERVLPRRIEIHLERKASKIVPLKIQYAGQLPEKLILSKAVLEPSEVEVYGPRSLIAKLKTLRIKPIDLETLNGNEEVPVEIQVGDERLSVTGANDIKFNYELRASVSNMKLTRIPIKFPPNRKTINTSVGFAEVKLYVPEKVMKNRSNVSSSVEVWAEIPPETRGNIEVPLKVKLPPTVHLLEINPKSIIVNIK